MVTTASLTTASLSPAARMAGIVVLLLLVALSLAVVAVAVGSEYVRRAAYREDPNTYYTGNRWARRAGNNRSYRVFFDGRRALGLRFRESARGRSAVVARVRKSDAYNSGQVKPGHFVRSVNGVDVRMMRYAKVLRLIREAERPVRLGFQTEDPAAQRPPLRRPDGEACPLPETDYDAA